MALNCITGIFSPNGILRLIFLIYAILMTHIMSSKHATVSCTLQQSFMFQKYACIDLIANVISPSQLKTQRFDPLCYEIKLYKIVWLQWRETFISLTSQKIYIYSLKFRRLKRKLRKCRKKHSMLIRWSRILEVLPRKQKHG